MLVWSERPKRVLILKKLGKALLPYLVEVAQLLRAQGCRVLVEERVLQEIEEEGGEQSFGLAGALQALPTERRHDALVVPDGAGIDCVVALGGDGVILHASSLFQGRSCPVTMGVHLGSLGFLCNFAARDIGRGLPLLLGLGGGGNAPPAPVPITLRMRLHCQVYRRGSDTVERSFEVLNEVLIDRGTNAFLSQIECFNRGQLLTTVQADGVMLATPTGSTAYSVSAGGSLVHPGVPAILFTPVCPHALSFRPILLPDFSEIELRVPLDARSACSVSFDGKHGMELERGDRLCVKMSENPVPTVNKEDGSLDFVYSLRRCLNWNDRDLQAPLEADAEALLHELKRLAVDNGAPAGADAVGRAGP